MIDGSLAFDIAASGMSAEHENLALIAQNLANADSVRASDGTPYRARYAVFEPASPFANSLQSAFDDFSVNLDDESDAPQGVRLASIEQAPAQYQYRFDPANPLAARAGAHNGYVAAPDVDPISQMVGLIAAGRAYDADVAVLQGAKQMDVAALDIDR